MSTPTHAPPTANGSDEFPIGIALLPVPGDRHLVMFHPETGWILVNPIPVAMLGDALVEQLIHLEPVVTEVPDDLINQFRARLKMGDDE